MPKDNGKKQGVGEGSFTDSGPPQLEEGQLKLLEAVKLLEAIKQVGHIKRLLPSEFGTELAERVVRQELLERVVRPELVERILAAMPRDDAIRAGLVCHQWHNVVSSSSFSKLCSRRLSACDKMCFPAKFTLDYWTSGLGLDMEQQKWHKLPSLCPFNPAVCLACHKGLLCLGKYRDRGCMEYWVANPVTGAERELPSLRSLIEGEEQLAVHYSSHLSAAFLEVDEDGQSYNLLGVCKRKTTWESLEAGPARIVRYRSGSSSWTLLTSRCQEAAEGTAGDVDLTLCELSHCYSDGMVDGKVCCAFNGGQVFGLVEGKGVGPCYFLVCFHVEAMTWECVCKLEKKDFHLPKEVVICNSSVMVVGESWKLVSPERRARQHLIVVQRYDPAQKTMVLETQLPAVKGFRDHLSYSLAHGPVMCIISVSDDMYTDPQKAAYVATYNASSRKWHNSTTEIWAFLPAIFARGFGFHGRLFPCAFELGLSTPV